MKKLGFSVVMAVSLIIATQCQTATAACSAVDSKGQTWYMPEVVKKTGKMQVTIGYLKDVKPCPAGVKPVIEEPNVVAACKAAMAHTCDPKTGAVRIFVNPTMKGNAEEQCRCLRVDSKPNPLQPGQFVTEPTLYGCDKVDSSGKRSCSP